MLQILEALRAAVKVGVSGKELNALAEKMIADAGAKPAFKGYGQPPFPTALCVSINDAVIHGIPNDQPLKAGDIISLDLGVNYQGYFTDSAVTIAVGEISAEAQKLLRLTQEALDLYISHLRPGKKLVDGGQAVERLITKNLLGLVRDYCGHGVGRQVHEEPSIPNFGRAGNGPLLEAGMVLAIEPMVTLGSGETRVADNQWDVVTADGTLAAHFEHTVIITADGAEIVT